MNDFINIFVWACQICLVIFFLRSAFRKWRYFDRVSAEFLRWGYPLPKQVTIFLILTWVTVAPPLLIPRLASASALILLLYMTVAFFTLVIHREWRRLWQPTLPIIALIVVLFGRLDDLNIPYLQGINIH